MPPARLKTAKAVLLDFDLTLVNSVPSILKVTNLFAADVGQPPITEAQLMSCIGLPLEETWVEFWGCCEPDWPQLYRDRYKDMETKGFLLFDDTISTLKALRAASIKTAVVTNRWMASFAVGNAGIGEYFDAIVGADEVARVKPHPEPVLRALELVGAAPEEALYVGDTVIDIEAGRGAGVLAVGVTTGAADKATLLAAGADVVIDHLGQVLALAGL
jgi:HAD superfamily hydrolase (TIGR01509 family)